MYNIYKAQDVFFENPIYRDEKVLLRQELQHENYLRLNRVNQYKRSKVLEKHKMLTTKNEEKKFGVFLTQNCAINKSISEQESSKEVFQFLEKLRMIDPYKINQKEKLINEIKELNDKYNLNLEMASLTVKMKKCNSVQDKN